MLRLMEHIKAVGKSVNGNALDASAILEQGHLGSLSVVVNDDGSTLSVSKGSVEFLVLHHILAECIQSLAMSPIWIRCVLVASLLSESFCGGSDVLNPNGLGKEVNHVRLIESVVVDWLEVELSPYLDESEVLPVGHFHSALVLICVWHEPHEGVLLLIVTSTLGWGF